MNAGFQQTVSPKMLAGYPGDIASAITAIDVFAKGYAVSALGDLTVGSFCFVSAVSNNTVAANSTDAGSTLIAGFVSKNTAQSYMNYTDSQIGYSNKIPAGTPAAQINQAGAFITLAKGVDATGTGDHVPALGDTVWVSLADGSVATAPASVTSVTGYVKAGFAVYKSGLYNTFVSLGANQALIQIEGSISAAVL
jgi:hypothetical protein